jgi:hypothetical protein
MFLAAQASLFKTPEGEAAYRAAYEVSLRLWPTPRESLDIATHFGLTHVVACGPRDGAPVVLLPAMSLSATMWYATVSGLCSTFRCYAADFPSDMGLSTPADSPANRSDCVERICRREGLKVPQKQKPRGRLWLSDGSCVGLRAERANRVWSYDFASAMTHDGRTLRLLTLIDEYTREG